MVKQHNGKFIFGTVKVGEKGQIVIPKEAREQYGIKPSDMLLVLGNEEGIALLNPAIFQQLLEKTMTNIKPIND